jgi:hypothetical protein
MGEFTGDTALGRLLRQRALGVSSLSITTDVPESQLRAVIDGRTSEFRVLWRLSSALDLHLADLLVMANVQIPETLAPLDSEAGGWVPALVQSAAKLSSHYRRRLIELARSLPQCERTKPVPEPEDYERYPSDFGGILVRMLENRNLRWVSSAKVLYLLGGSPPMSAHVIGALGQGRRKVTPRLLADFAAVLGISAGELAAVGGMEIREEFPVSPAASDLSMLIWETRRLTREQVRQLGDEAVSIRHG